MTAKVCSVNVGGREDHLFLLVGSVMGELFGHAKYRSHKKLVSNYLWRTSVMNTISLSLRRNDSTLDLMTVRKRKCCWDRRRSRWGGSWTFLQVLQAERSGSRYLYWYLCDCKGKFTADRAPSNCPMREVHLSILRCTTNVGGSIRIAGFGSNLGDN